MNIVLKIIKILDRLTEIIGKSVACFAVIMVLVTCYVVISRYVLNTGSVAMQECVNYFNAILVFASVGYTLIYGPASARYKIWLNLLGSILLLIPVAVFILVASWDYVMSSWAIMEDSPEANGLPFVYLLKSIIPLMCILLLLQGFAELLRNLSLLLSPDISILNIKEEESSAL